LPIDVEDDSRAWYEGKGYRRARNRELVGSLDDVLDIVKEVGDRMEQDNPA